MKIELKFAELHTPLFMSGVNHGTKLDNIKRGVKLVYDRQEKELIIFHNGEIGIIPATNVAAMIPINPSELGYKMPETKTVTQAPSTTTTQPRGKIKAQVSSPVTDAVFGRDA